MLYTVIEAITYEGDPEAAFPSTRHFEVDPQYDHLRDEVINFLKAISDTIDEEVVGFEGQILTTTIETSVLSRIGTPPLGAAISLEGMFKAYHSPTNYQIRQKILDATTPAIFAILEGDWNLRPQIPHMSNYRTTLRQLIEDKERKKEAELAATTNRFERDFDL